MGRVEDRTLPLDRGTPHILVMKVTFDSNTYRRATNPDFFAKDPAVEDYRVVHAAILDGRVTPYLSETVITLESITNRTRGAFYSGVSPNVSFEEQANSDGTISVAFTLGPKPGAHPGIPPTAQKWLDAALALGFHFLRAPRIGQPKPTYLDRPEIYADDDGDIGARIDRTHKIGRELETRGVGYAVAVAIGERINLRLGRSEPWYPNLDKTKDDHEEREMQRSISEWADGDTVSAHVGYGSEILCTQDQGKSAGSSVFDPTNRAWLTSAHGVMFETLSGLAARLQQAAP